MTRQEWDTSDDVDGMLAFLDTERRRQLLLFAAACCRRIVHLNLGDWSASTVSTVEALADGVDDPPTLAAAVLAAEDVFEAAGGIITPAEEAVFSLLLYPQAGGGQFAVQDARRVCTAAARAVGYETVPNEQSGLGQQAREELIRRRRAAEEAERVVQTYLLREVFGNPFNPSVIDSAWKTSTVLALARQAYESRDFSAMPILADALQDAGCDSEEILHHCRNTQQTHVRGCWVVDLVLGKVQR